MLLSKAGVAYLLDKDPAAVARYSLPEPDVEIMGANGKLTPSWKVSTIQDWTKNGKTQIKLSEAATERLAKSAAEEDDTVPQVFIVQGDRMVHVASVPSIRIMS